MERKVFNFNSIILKEKTIEKYGYDPDKFGKSSSKFVVATCRFCGKDSNIRKGFFNKSGSACHKLCKIEEQKLNSPFKSKETREKALNTIKERYGDSRESIKEKISISKKNSNEKTKQTCLEKYGVENVFQAKEVRKKIKETNLERYGFENPMKNIDIAKKVKNTNLERYGVDNPLKREDIKEKIKEMNIEMHNDSNINKFDFFIQKTKVSCSKNISGGENENHLLCNELNGNNFWDLLKQGLPLKEVCKRLNLNYQSCTSVLLKDEYREKYYSNYTFPKAQIQKKIYDLLVSYGFSVLMNDKSVISPLELDIYIPEKKFAIEFNGSYSHSEAALDTTESRMKHKGKLDLCRKNGVYLFNIFEHQWIAREKQFLNFIKTILGLNSIKIAARKCVVANYSSKEFIDENHIQGWGARTIQCFNLIYNNEIVGSMTASPHHRQNVEDGVIVLNRLCFKDGYSIQGGASRLFSAFCIWAKNKGYTKILSWSDNCWTEGKIYEILGFKFKEEYKPDYFYWDPKGDCYRSKQSQRKVSNGCPPEITERDWCYSHELYRIYDCGKKLFEYTL